jgi:hypothetical protein
MCSAGQFVPFYPADVWASWDYKLQGPSATMLVWTFLCIAFVGMLNACKQRISFLSAPSPSAAPSHVHKAGSGYSTLPNNPTPHVAASLPPQPEAANLQPSSEPQAQAGYQASEAPGYQQFGTQASDPKDALNQ